MRIVIATPSYPPRVAGPSQYADGVARAWRKQGFEVQVVSFDSYLHLPTGIRHVAYTWALMRAMRGASFVLALDIFSVALPTVIVAWLYRTKCLIRVSGDFMWEGFIERGGPELTMREFYAQRQVWTLRERFLFLLSRQALRMAHGIIFQNHWQQEIVVKEFALGGCASVVIRNHFPEVALSTHHDTKKFVWAGRPIRLKNVDRLQKAFAAAKAIDDTIELAMYTSLPREELFQRLREAYVIINPSLSDMNPNIVLEGLSLGKPCICTQESGIKEVSEGMGIFVDPKDTHAIRDAILAMADPDTYATARTAIASKAAPRPYDVVARELFAFAESV